MGQMSWCVYDPSSGRILMDGVCSASQTVEDFSGFGGTPIFYIPPGVSFSTHYYHNGEFREFGPSPGEFYAWDWATHAWELSSTALDEARAKQSAILNSACRESIYSGFDSSALGAPHHYPAKVTDQSNLVASVTASLLPNLPEGWTTPFWCETAGMWAYKMHSAAQIQQAGADGKAAIIACLSKNAMLQGQVNAETTIAAVQEIMWTN